MSDDDVRAQNEELQRAYSLTFASPHAAAVLADLVRFCRAIDGRFHPDARVSAALEGRAEVFHRIYSLARLSLEEIYALRLNRTRPIAQKEDTDG